MDALVAASPSRLNQCLIMAELRVVELAVSILVSRLKGGATGLVFEVEFLFADVAVTVLVQAMLAGPFYFSVEGAFRQRWQGV